MSETEYRLIKVSVQILKTQLTVRFPCSLQYTLKSDNQMITSDKLYELKNGVCSPNEIIDFELEIETNEEDYVNTKVILGVIMVSANGKFPAGSVAIQIAEGGQLFETDDEQVRSIDKCPDKLAKINFQISFDFIKTIRKQRTESKLSSDFKGLNHRSASSSYVNSTKYSMKESLNYPKKQSESTMILSNEASKLLNEKKYRTDRVSRYEQNHERGEKKFVESDSGRSVSEENSCDARKWETNEKRIENLKTRNYGESRVYTTRNSEEQIAKFRFDLQESHLELSKMKEKYNALLRKERAQQQEVKELVDQIERNKNKLLIIENLGSEQKSEISEKQIKISHLEEELRNLKESINEEKRNSSFQEKRIEYKETVLNEQLKKMSEKYQQSELERQKAVQEMNQMLNEFENSEKKSLLTLKEKEKKLIEDKNKITKRVEEATFELTSLKEENQILRAEIEELKSSQKQSNKTKTGIESSLSDLQSKYQQLLETNKKKDDQIQVNLSEINEFKAENQRLLAIEHKYHENCSEIIKLKESENRLNRKIEILNKSQFELENRLNEALNGKEALMSKNTELLKDVQNAKKTNEERLIENQELRESKQNLMLKIEEMKIKFDKERIGNEQINIKLQDEITYASKIKSNLSNDFEEIKWKLQKSEEALENERSRNLELSEKVMKNEEECRVLEDKLRDLMEANSDQESTIIILTEESKAKELKEKELQNTIKLKIETEYENSKVLKEREIELAVLYEKESQKTLIIEESKKKLESALNDKESQKNDFERLVEGLKEKINKLTFEREGLQRELKRIEEEKHMFKNDKKSSDKILNEAQIELLNKNRAIEELDRQLHVSNNNEKALESVRRKQEEEINNLLASFDKYKKDIANSFLNFTDELCKEIEHTQSDQVRLAYDSSIDRLLNNFSEQHLCNLQLKCIRKKSEVHFKNQEKIKKLEDNVMNLENEINLKNALSTKSISSLENVVVEFKNKHSSLLETLQREREEYEHTISQKHQEIQEALREKEKYRFDLQTISENLGEVKSELHQRNKDKENLTKDVERINNVCTELEAKIENERKSTELLLSNTYEENRASEERLKEELRQLQRVIDMKEAEAQEFLMSNGELSSLLSSRRDEIENLILKIQETERTLQEQVSQNRSHVSANQSLVKRENELSEQLKKVNKELESTVQKKEDFNLQLIAEKETSRSLTVYKEKIEVDLNKVTFEKETLLKSFNKLEENLKVNRELFSNEVKTLKETISTLQNDIELKEFMMKQLEGNFGSSKSQIAEILKELESKKKEILSLNSQLSKVQNDNVFLRETVSSEEFIKKQLYHEIGEIKNKIVSLERELSEHYVAEGIVREKDREIIKMTNDMLSLEANYQGIIKELRDTSNELANETEMRKANELEFTRKINNLEKELEFKNVHFQSENQKQINSHSNERNEMLSDLKFLEKENERLNQVNSNLREDFQRELETLNHECASISGFLAEKESLLYEKNKKIEESENRIKMISNEFRKCMEVWENEKRQESELKKDRSEAKTTKIVSEISAKSLSLLTSFNSSTSIN